MYNIAHGPSTQLTIKFQSKKISHSPCDDATIFFLSSTEASLRHKDGYLLYKDPLNIRK